MNLPDKQPNTEGLGTPQIVPMIEELILAVNNLAEPADWIFRGVHNERFTLQPSLGRARHLASRAPPVTAQVEERALRHFQNQVRPHVGLNLVDSIEWMVLAQHHGMPTRLLDWTTSVLVAAYFAVTTMEGSPDPVTGVLTADNGLITAVKRPPEIREQDRRRPTDIDAVRLIIPPHVSERVARQCGLLTIHPDPAQAWEPTEALRFVIPGDRKLLWKHELDRLGINEASLMPGIDGVARYLGWQLKWGRL